MDFREGHVLPTVRIQKIVLEKYKSVSYGEVLFNCGRKKIPQDTEADILGIYGQNGSGKTAVIEALSILKQAMTGRAIDARYSECISKGADYSKFTFVFDFQYPPDNITRTITYSFKLGTQPNEAYIDFDEVNEGDDYNVPLSSLYRNTIKIFDEVVSASGLFGGRNQKMQDILTSSGKNYPIGPARKLPHFVGSNKEGSAVELEVCKRTASKNSSSFIFSKDTMELFHKYSGYSEFFQVLMELHFYAVNYLYVVDTRLAGLGGYRFAAPLFTRRGDLPMPLLGPSTKVSQEVFEQLESVVNGINMVLPSMVTGLQLEIAYNEVVKGEKTWKEIRFNSRRNGFSIPLRDESAGLIRIISIISLIISAFNDRSITVAIDELDAGVYEYLLGELLGGLETYGKGQFIFTSHNLRPLEVLKKESIIFTTTNPDNRYIRLKGVGHTNNLRSLYLREILGNSQDEKIYDAEKKQRMYASFMRAGVGYGEEE